MDVESEAELFCARPHTGYVVTFFLGPVVAFFLAPLVDSFLDPGYNGLFFDKSARGIAQIQG
jgi:hypothetical protein